MAVDVDLVERELRRIPEIRAARIVTDDAGSPVEVHVLATPAKHVKQLVRDVQTVAIASAGLDLDHRIVSVVQLDEDIVAPGLPARALTAGAERVTLVGVQVDRTELRCTARVRLRSEDAVAEGAAEGTVAAGAVRRAVAEATLQALSELRPVAASASVEAASVVRLGEHDVAVAVLAVVVPPYEEVVSGSAPVRASGVDDAVARAVLGASNRRLAR